MPDYTYVSGTSGFGITLSEPALTPEEKIVAEQRLAQLINFLTGLGPPVNDRGSGTVHGIGDVVVVVRASPGGVFKKIFLDASPTGGSGDELQRGENPNGSPRAGYVLVVDPLSGRGQFIMLPMWATDP